MIHSRRQRHKERRKQRQEEHRPEPEVVETVGEDESEEFEPESGEPTQHGELYQLEQQLLGGFDRAIEKLCQRTQAA